MENKILKVEELKRWYTIGEKDKQKIDVLKGLSFDVEEGELIGIMGRSGCRKKTPLKTL